MCFCVHVYIRQAQETGCYEIHPKGNMVVCLETNLMTFPACSGVRNCIIGHVHVHVFLSVLHDCCYGCHMVVTCLSHAVWSVWSMVQEER